MTPQIPNMTVISSAPEPQAPSVGMGAGAFGPGFGAFAGPHGGFAMVGHPSGGTDFTKIFLTRVLPVAAAGIASTIHSLHTVTEPKSPRPGYAKSAIIGGVTGAVATLLGSYIYKGINPYHEIRYEDDLLKGALFGAGAGLIGPHAAVRFREEEQLARERSRS